MVLASGKEILKKMANKLHVHKARDSPQQSSGRESGEAALGDEQSV